MREEMILQHPQFLNFLPRWRRMVQVCDFGAAKFSITEGAARTRSILA
jgi:hypothetical protein